MIVQFPKPKNLKCNMMPFVQGDSKSLPKEYQSYAELVDNCWIEKGEIGFLTLDESYVVCGKTQRGYNSKGVSRNVHIEVGLHQNSVGWGSPIPTWGSRYNVTLDPKTKVLISNSLSDTCRVWDNVVEQRETLDGDLSDYLQDYPEETGRLLKAGELALISIFTPHECVPQKESSFRQFFRIVGKGVFGREDYFTKNPLLSEV